MFVTLLIITCMHVHVDDCIEIIFYVKIIWFRIIEEKKSCASYLVKVYSSVNLIDRIT